jgi:hypothetical protein
LAIVQQPKRKPKLTLKKSKEICGTISTSNKKLNCPSWSLSPTECITGSKLAKNPKSVCSKCYADRMQKFRSNIEVSWNRNHTKYMVSKITPESKKEWTNSMIHLIDDSCKKMNVNYFRWFVGGDIPDTEFIERAFEIANRMQHINFWLPTKEYSLIKNIDLDLIPDNLTIRVSNPMINPKSTHSLHPNTSTSFTKDAPIKLGSVCKEYCEPCNYKCWKKDIKNITYIMH